VIETLLVAPGAFGNPHAVVVTLIAVVVLLALRAWSQTMGVVLTRSILFMLDAAIGVLGVLFFVLVAIRFATIG
jgi:hypothetical protein